MKMKKLIKWLGEGGNKRIGYDHDGDPLYSLSNGENLLFWFFMVAGIIFTCAIMTSLIMALRSL